MLVLTDHSALKAWSLAAELDGGNTVGSGRDQHDFDLYKQLCTKHLDSRFSQNSQSRFFDLLLSVHISHCQPDKYRFLGNSFRNHAWIALLLLQ
jgi:hypothetical protein